MKKSLLLIGVFVFFISASLFSQTKQATNPSVNKVAQQQKASSSQQLSTSKLDKQVVTSKQVSATSAKATRKNTSKAKINREVKAKMRKKTKQ